jgi:hypothetical protein
MIKISSNSDKQQQQKSLFASYKKEGLFLLLDSLYPYKNLLKLLQAIYQTFNKVIKLKFFNYDESLQIVL